MRKIKYYFLGIVALSLIICSCEQLDKLGLSEKDIVEGLKTALNVGTDSSVTKTSSVDGYLKDQAIKILLPSEAKIIQDNIQYIDQLTAYLPGNIKLSEMVDQTITSMNRAAESAAKQAGPIFKGAITSLSITDGLGILNGTNPAGGSKKSGTTFDSTAATHYLQSTTQDTLVTLYKKPVDAELGKDLGLGFSANSAYSTMVEKYNYIADVAKTVLDNDYFNLIPNDKKVMLQKFTIINQPATLGEYVTNAALKGLFSKVGEQEVAIRRDPLKWAGSTVGPIFEKVFGGK